MTLHLVLRNQLSEISRLAHIMIGFGEERRFSQELIHDINLVLEEVISNIIRYGYDDEELHQIDLHISCNEQELALTVHDDAKAFNPLHAPKPDLDTPLEERPIGGLGIYLTRRLMDRLDYTREHGKNMLTLKKYLGRNGGEL